MTSEYQTVQQALTPIQETILREAVAQRGLRQESLPFGANLFLVHTLCQRGFLMWNTIHKRYLITWGGRRLLAHLEQTNHTQPIIKSTT